MRATILFGLLFALVPLATRSEECVVNGWEQFARESNLPGDAWGLVQSNELLEKYRVDVCHLNPFYLRGDFDGDATPDFVLRVRPLEAGDPRLVVLFGTGDASWLDRDERLRYPGPGAWSVLPRAPLEQSPYEEAPPPVPVGEILVFRKLESSASLVLWDGSRFVSYWVGD